MITNKCTIQQYCKCENCNEFFPIPNKNKRSRFCSKPCRNKWHYNNK